MDSFLSLLWVPLFVFAPTFGISFILSLFLKKNYQILPFVSQSIIISLLFLAGIFDILKPISIMLYIISSTAFLLGIIQAFRKKGIDYYLKHDAFSTWCFWLLFCLFFWLKIHDSILLGWDELTHWALVTLELVQTHALVKQESIRVVLDYPPGTNLFQYFFLSLTGYKEDILSWVTFLIPASVIPLVLIFNQKNRITNVGLIFLSYFVLTGLGMPPNSIYVDHIVAAYFGGVIIQFWLLKKNDQSLLWLTPTLFVAPLIKNFGLHVGLVALVIISSLFILEYINNKRKQLSQPKWKIKKIFTLLVCFLTLLASSLTWKAYLNYNNIKPYVDMSPLTLESFAKEVLSTEAEARSKDIRARYIRALVVSPIIQHRPSQIIFNKLVQLISPEDFIPSLSATTFLIVFLILIFYITNYKRDDAIPIRLNSVFLMFGYIFYTLGVLGVYILILGIDGFYLMSFDRYQNLYLGGVAWFLLYVISIGSGTTSKKSQLLWIIIFSLLLFQTPNLRFILNSKSWITSEDNYQTRLEMKQKTELIKEVVSENESVFTIHQNSSGLPAVISRYELFPRRYNHGAWTLGKLYHKDDWYTRNFSTSEVSKLWYDYDYLFLSYADKQFWDTYGSLFKGVKNPDQYWLYKIKKDDTTIQLQPILKIDKESQ